MRLTLELADDLVPAELVLVEDTWITLKTLVFTPVGDTMVLRFPLPGTKVCARIEVVVQGFEPAPRGPEMLYRTLIRHADPRHVDILAGRRRPAPPPSRSPSYPVVASRFPGAPLNISLTDAQAYVHAWTTGMKQGLLHAETIDPVGDTVEVRLLLPNGQNVRIAATVVDAGLLKLHMKRVLHRKLDALAADAFDDIAAESTVPQLDEHGEVLPMPADEPTETVYPLPDDEVFELHPEAADVFAMPAYDEDDEETELPTEIPA